MSYEARTVKGAPIRTPHDVTEILGTQLKAHHDRMIELTLRISERAKMLARGGPPRSDPELDRLVGEFEAARAAGDAVAERLASSLGVPLSAFDPPDREYRSDYAVSQIRDVPPDGFIEVWLERAVTDLRSRLSSSWLHEQEKLSWRLDEEFLQEPLQLVGGLRLESRPRPQRLAHMLFLGEDYLGRHDNFDFFEGALLVPELAMLGHQLELLPELGPAAQEKVGRLHLVPDGEVASGFHELLVGLAAVRQGLSLQMLETSPSEKRPDFRVHFPSRVPTVIECKRKSGLTEYELAEAEHAKSLFDALASTEARHGYSGRVDVEFSVEVGLVAPEEFSRGIAGTLSQWEDTKAEFPWGRVECVRLPFVTEFPRTRLYSPRFLAAVLGVAEWPSDWDGLVCTVADTKPVLATARAPFCVRWRSASDVALAKKARGVNSFFGDATKQVPDGEMGVIHIAYVERNRQEFADARTQAIRDQSTTWSHGPWKTVPLVIVDRLHPRPIAEGQPDLIESALVFEAGSAESGFASLFPSRVFTPLGGRT